LRRSRPHLFPRHGVCQFRRRPKGRSRSGYRGRFRARQGGHPRSAARRPPGRVCGLCVLPATFQKTARNQCAYCQGTPHPRPGLTKGLAPVQHRLKGPAQLAMTRGAYLGMLAITAVMVLGLSLLYGPVDGEVDRSGRMLWRLPFADGPWSYWWHHAFVVIPVAALSFEHRIRYFSRWKQVLLASLAPAAIYIGWDILFTANGIWDFDDAKTAGQRLLGLPVEEWLWFFTIPFAVIFIHENLR